MLRENFADYLGKDVQLFLHDYVQMLSEYGHSSYFPLRYDEKLKQWQKLNEILGKLEHEDFKEFEHIFQYYQTKMYSGQLKNSEFDSGKAR